MFSKNIEESTDKEEIGVFEFNHSHQEEIDVFPEHDQLKFVPSSSTMLEGTSKSTLNMNAIKTYINTNVDKQIADLKTLISNIPVEVVKALKKEENKESPHEDEDKGPVIEIRINEPSDENMIDKEENCEEESKNTHCTDIEDLLDERMDDKEECRDEELKKQYSPVMDNLPDEHMDDKEQYRDEELKIQHSPDMKDLSDDVGGTITNSVQDVVDALLFGLSTPTTTKSLDISTPNIVTESQWTIFDSQFSPDFPDAQVREREATKAPDEGNSDDEEKQMYAFDGCTIYQELPNQLILDYSQWLEEGLLKYHAGKKQTDNHYLKYALNLGYSQLDFIHLGVIFYHLRKKSKLQQCDNYKYTTTSYFVKTYIEKTYNRYYPVVQTDQISTQEDYAESYNVAKNEDAITNTINGFCIPAGLPWHMVDEVYVFVNCDKEFHWILDVIVLKERVIRVYDSLSSKKKK
ncbi:uncharacterized protein LOC124885840 [Capsicum annuum]|uniref:uncharacterized protein LOC124885840 n=1 Tax=Capsicum annuum TaxID=4072 RepID=UPI001FB17BBF|nr:uncharacterized protein LOC124885840 [Capsicum annuum]